MKVTKENNGKMVKLSIVAILSTFIFSFQTINDNTALYFFLYIIIEATFITLLMYLIAILQFEGESISVQSPFSIFLGLEVVKFIGGVLFPVATANLLSSIATIELIIFVYIVIAAFKVKSEKISSTYRLLGITLLLTALVRLVLLIGPFLNSGAKLTWLLIIIKMMETLPMFAIYYIIHKTGKYLQNDKINVSSQ